MRTRFSSPSVWRWQAPSSRPALAAAPQTITNGTQFTDSGNPVHAHGGGVIKVGSYYYWFGENRNADNTFRYVDAYRSTDLKNWEFRNHVLTEATDPELATANIERRRSCTTRPPASS